MSTDATIATTPKPKKSVALSGVPAGNTALCTVGRQGNDLHYRGYDILDFAEQAQFEEVAYLLVHGKLPTLAELSAYKQKLKALRGLPAAVKAALESTKDFKGITGAITFAPGSHVPQKGVTVIDIEGGKLTLGGEVVPEKVPSP